MNAAAWRRAKKLLTEPGVAGIGDGLVSEEASGFEAAADLANLKSPKTYVGYQRAENFASGNAVLHQRRT